MQLSSIFEYRKANNNTPIKIKIMSTFRIVSTPTQFLIIDNKESMSFMTVENNVYPHVFFSKNEACDYLDKYIDNSDTFPVNNSGVYLCN